MRLEHAPLRNPANPAVPAVPVVAAHGLTLEEVGYPSDEEVALQAERSRRRWVR